METYFPYLNRYCLPLTHDSNTKQYTPKLFAQDWHRTLAQVQAARSQMPLQEEDLGLTELEYETNEELCERLIKEFKNVKPSLISAHKIDVR
jgi:hypothetical protein